ncbi:putative nucleolar pre-ribosomal-associated protein [Tanacetum coccineum]
MSAHPSASHYVQEIADTIFCHPAINAVVESPLSVNSELKDNIFEHPVDDFLCSAKEGIHTMDYRLLQVLEIFCNQFSLSNDVNKQITRTFKCVIQNLVLMLKSIFEQFIESKDPLPLIPTLFAIYCLVRFISPQELLGLAYWIFSRIDLSSVHKSSKFSTLSDALNIAGCAFEFMQEVDVTLFEKVYFHVVETASRSELLVANLCLLKVVKIANTRSGRTSQSLPQSMVMFRVVASTPKNLLSNCLKKPSTIKGQLLSHLTESSLVHLSFFGLSFMEMDNKSIVGKKRKSGVCDDDLLMLLSTALSFISFISIRYGEKCSEHVGNIRSLYWDILSNGFSNWKDFVSRDLFHVTLDKFVPSTAEELCVCFDTSLLGKSVAVMQQHLVSSGAAVKRSKRLKLFDSLIPSGTDNLLDCNALIVLLSQGPINIHFFSLIISLNLNRQFRHLSRSCVYED